MTRSLSKEEWAEVLRNSKVRWPDPDPRFPDRPRSGFFRLISHNLRAADLLSEHRGGENSVEMLAEFLGGSADDLAYASKTRIAMVLQEEMPGLDRIINHWRLRTLMVGLWLDGWINGALYANQHPTVGAVDIEGEHDEGS